MAKKKNSRKALAVALGIMGVAGLSVASASTLNLTAGNEVAIGTDTFAACDTDGVAVDYAYAANSAAASGYAITNITVTGIAAACANEPLTLTLADTAATPATLFTGSVASLTNGGTATLNASASNIDVATDLGKVTVIIG